MDQHRLSKKYIEEHIGSIKSIMQLTGILFLILFVPDSSVFTDWVYL